jgi:hypothetical protein
MRRIALVSLMGLGLLVNGAFGDTYVSGTITANIIWNLAGSPYVATDTVTVANEVVLTIEPGATIRFATETSLICYGTLNAVGTPIGTITFTSSQTTPTASDWNGIKLSGNGANGSKISYCDIGYAEQAIYLENVSGVTIINNYIHDNKGDNGTYGNYIHDNKGDNGTYGYPGQPGKVGCGIYLSGANNNFIGTNTIGTNTGGVAGYTAVYSQATGDIGTIGCGIYLSSSTGNTIQQNIISSNQGGIGGAGWYGGIRPRVWGLFHLQFYFRNSLQQPFRKQKWRQCQKLWCLS